MSSLTTFLLDIFQWINKTITGNFGVTIVLFTIALRIVSLPIDIHSRKGQRDFARKTAKIQPELDRINKAYKNNPEVMQRKTLELRKSVGLGFMPKGCFSQLLIYPLLFAFFAVFRNMAAIQILDLANSSNPQAWMDQNSFLWIKNIWMPDNAFTLGNIPILKDTFLKFLFSGIHSDIIPTGTFLTGMMKYLPGGYAYTADAVSNTMNSLAQTYIGSNGLFILPILAGALQYFSFKFSQKFMAAPAADPNNPQGAQNQKVNKFMNIFFPLLFTWFCLTSSSALAIYWITSSLVMLVTNYLINVVLVAKEKKEEALLAQGIPVAVKPPKETFSQKFMKRMMEQAERNQEALNKEKDKDNK